MNNLQVAEKWREQIKDGGHSLNMFYEREVIYSYGYHFPMAFITPLNNNGKRIVFQNSDGYSNTTSRHLSHMRMQCLNDAVIEIPTELLKRLITEWTNRTEPSKKTLGDCIDVVEARIVESELKLKRARTEWSKERHQRDIDENEEQIRILVTL